MNAARPDATAPPVVGLVGLGLVGTALGGRLMQAGYDVLGHDHRDEACAAWRESGRNTATLREIGAACATIVLAVFDTAGVLEVIEGGLLDADAPAVTTVQTIIDCSTGDPDALETLAARLALRGIDFIEAPLSGSSRQIAAGAATMLLGGEAAAIARCAPLQVLAAERIHVGGAGMGARAKLATNLVLGLNRAVLAEGLVFAEKLGIAPATFLQLVLATPARSDAALAKGEMMVNGEFTPPQSRIRQHLKDVDLMLAAAQATGQRLPLSEAHAELLRAAVEAGDGDLDNAAVVRQLRREGR
jgi:3-hydroxyisobutyrate dehydrogenase-like beta-hydroxyacid dehydrogenase